MRAIAGLVIFPVKAKQGIPYALTLEKSWCALIDFESIFEIKSISLEHKLSIKDDNLIKGKFIIRERT